MNFVLKVDMKTIKVFMDTFGAESEGNKMICLIKDMGENEEQEVVEEKIL